jgi:hypothetical protein
MAAPATPTYSPDAAAEDTDDNGVSAAEESALSPPPWIQEMAAAKAGGQVVDDEYVCRGLALQRSGSVFAAAFSSLPKAQQDMVSCVVCTNPCPQPVSGMRESGDPCCAFANWLCAACLARSMAGGRACCPLCKRPVKAGSHLPFPPQRIDERLVMLSFDCCAPGCGRRGLGDAQALVKHLADVHGPAEKELYKREVKILHYDVVREGLCKARARACQAAIKHGAVKAELQILARSLRKREEKLSIKHAEQLSAQEALLVAGSQRYEELLHKKQKDDETEAYKRLGELCFDAVSQQLRGYIETDNEPRDLSKVTGSRSRSPRLRQAAVSFADI